MASNFNYKRTTQTTMKVAGILDILRMTIDVDGETKSLATLLSPFQGTAIDLNVKVKDEEELEDPTIHVDEDIDDDEDVDCDE